MHDSANQPPGPSSREHLSRETVLTRAARAGDPVTGSIIWLHGLGADGNDFVPMVPALQRCQDLPLRFLFPHAPVRPVTINGGMHMRAWYDIRGIDLAGERLLDHDGIEQSVAQVQEMIAEQNGHGVDSNRIIVAGFSQGGVIALQTGLRLLDQLMGIIGLSCYLPGAPENTGNGEPARPLPAFIGHGRQDPMVPFALGQRAAEVLRQNHCDVTWGEYPVAHGVHPDEIAAVDAWIAKLMQ